MAWSTHIVFATFCCYVVITYGQQSSVRNNTDRPPEDCNTNRQQVLDSYRTVEDFDRCAPYLLPDLTRKYYEGAAGRQRTMRENKMAYEGLHINPKILKDVSRISSSVTVLNSRISMPICVSPTANHKLASNLGEIDTVRAVSGASTLMVVSSMSNTLSEDVARAAPGTVLWQHTYIFKDRSVTEKIIKRAEILGFRDIVVTVDSPIYGNVPVSAFEVLQSDPRNLSHVNVEPGSTDLDASITFRDLAWVKKITILPVVAKGILRPEDAIQAAKAGVSAVWVSNHGGRQLDYTPPTIEALPKVVDALKLLFPRVEVYVDGGVRNGWSVFKAVAGGARCVFLGRPVLWGLAAGGQRGVAKVLNILRTELNETMILAGTPSVHDISREMVTPYCTYESKHSLL